MDDPFLLALEERRLKREAERTAWNKRAAQLNAEGEADAVAKRVYLETVKPASAVKPSPKPDAVEPAPQATVEGGAAAEEIPVKDMILTVLRDAYPLGLTAKQIKGKAYMRFKKHINPNTLTVSLGRYSKPKDGEPRLARCDGRTWFYVRHDVREIVRGAVDLLNGRHMGAAE
ncbi:MAG: hypothetical protein H0U98_03860 [Alphaproteobacteria bacterium]|nr:hypothetical protein [Alphaproteobacteria bacterium]